MITKLRRYSIVLYIGVLMNVYNDKVLHKNLQSVMEACNVHTLTSFTFIGMYTSAMVFLLWKSLHYITAGDIYQGLAVGAVAALFVTLLRAEVGLWRSVLKALRWRGDE